MDNKTIANIFTDIYNGFWLKWRDRVPDRDSDEWNTILNEADAILTKYGTHSVLHLDENKNKNFVEDPIVAPLILWFIEQMEARERANHKAKPVKI